MQGQVNSLIGMMEKNRKPKGSKTNPYKFIDLFAGIGGFRLGLERVRMHAEKQGMNPERYLTECVFSSEIDKYCRQSY